MKLSAKLRKILWSGFRATLNNWKFKVALNPPHRMFLNVAEIFILACWSLLCNKILGSPSSFSRYEQLKPKYWVFLQGFPVAMVTYCVTKITASCSAIIEVSYGTITLLLRNSVVVSILLIERFSIECRKTKTKVITLANQKRRRQSSKPIKTRSNYM